MKSKLAVALTLALTTVSAAHALTFEGTVEKTDVLKKRSFFARLFSVNEGRIGVRISSDGHVEYVHPGSPAEKVGLHKDDWVRAVDGRTHSIEKISGDPGTTVNLQVKRGEDDFAVEVERVDWHDIHR
ncbi:MAG TPA: PDZ domain-containing protein [Candidatus Obscuribacterales bacterium]